LELTLGDQARASVEPETGSKKAIQDVLLAEGLLAVKASVDCETLEQLQQVLYTKLGQNSVVTRRRYAQSIARWFFPDGIDGLLRRVWVIVCASVVIAYVPTQARRHRGQRPR